MSVRPLILLAAVASVAPLGHAVTPAEKVVQLLERLKAQVIEEGKTEATAYDNYANFCRSQANEKTYSISKGQEKIELLTGEVDALAGDITKLNQEIGDLSAEVEGLEQKCAGETKDREVAHKTYLGLEADLTASVSGAADAIQVLKSSKAPGSALAQENIASFMQRAAAVEDLPDKSQQLMTAIMSLLEENPNGVEFHSGAVVEQMQDLMKKFKAHKNDLDKEENLKSFAFNLAQGARKNQIQSLSDAIKESQEQVSVKEEDKTVRSQDKSQTETDVNADTAFLDDLTTQCQDKEDSWDARSKTREEEIATLTEALKTLKGNVVDNYAANKKLTALVAERTTISRAKAGSAAGLKHWVWVEDKGGKSSANSSSAVEAKEADADAAAAIDAAGAASDTSGSDGTVAAAEDEADDAWGWDGAPGVPSFLQKKVQKKGPTRELLLATRSITYLRKRARDLRSSVLSGLVLRVRGDNFVKVRGMINGMIASLEADATSEADQKVWCDGEIERATKGRDDNSANVEGDMADVTAAESKIARLSEEENGVLQQISELKQGVHNATQLRTDEKANNEAAAKAAADGLAGVTTAIQMIKDFYGTALLQRRAGYQPPKADASGKTVGDLAPETFSGEYRGNQDAASGIVGQLDVVKSDFEGAISATNSAESEAAEEFEKYASETQQDVEEKEELVNSKQDEQELTRGALMDAKDKWKEHTRLKAEALDELGKLKPACVDPTADYDAKVQRREEDIDSLRNAYNILDDMR